MDKKTIEIRITGSAGSGKTTVAALIEAALKDHGVEVCNLDPDSPPILNDPGQRGWLPGAVAEKVSVVIETVQIKREPMSTEGE